MNRLILMILCSSIFLGCMGTYVFINKDYTVGDRKLTITLFPIMPDAVIVGDRKKFHKRFDTDSREAEIILRDTSYIHILNGFEDSTRNINVVASPSLIDDIQRQSDANHFNEINMKITKDSIPYTFYVPKYETVKKYAEEANAVIAINKLVYTYERASAGTATMAGSGPKLVITVHYIVYDYSVNEI
ncbi:MAG: hypothetical protein GY861_20050, partial [bacterium]|nr:hypothetical protein [bacterium]